MKLSPPLLVSAGEPSGDRAAARVVEVLTSLGIGRFYGICGSRMEKAGVESISNFESMTALGLFDSVRNIRRWAEAWTTIRERIANDRPGAALLVDSPEFHLPLARVLKSSGVPVIWYIGPQVWAWRRRRLSLLKDRTDAVALILPFEKPLYDEASIYAEFVGHPLLDEPPPKGRDAVRRALDISNEEKVIALLPGSRPAEISRHLPALTTTARLLQKKGIVPMIAPGGSFEIEQCPTGDQSLFLSRDFTARDLLSASDAALVASGTATLEAALIGVPQAVVYRTDPISGFIGKTLLSLPYIALPNWILRQKVLPELLQRDITPGNLLFVAMRLLDATVAASQRTAFRKIGRLMGGPGAAERVASLVLGHLRFTAR